MMKSIVGCCALLLAGAASAAGTSAPITEQVALGTCQTALRKAARDPELAQIPDVGAMKGGADWRYMWNGNSRQVRMRNGLGQEVAAGALCVVDETSGQIKLLVLNGQQLISPSGR
jgi:hypothetical protein